VYVTLNHKMIIIIIIIIITLHLLLNFAGKRIFLYL
jgi:hypothetical protein